MYNTTMLDLVYGIIGFNPDEFARHEIHTNIGDCIFVWDEEESPTEFAKFANEGQLNFAKMIAPKYYQYLPPVGMNLSVMRILFPIPKGDKNKPRFSFGLKYLGNNKHTKGIDDDRWKAGGYSLPLDRNACETRIQYENKPMYVFGV